MRKGEDGGERERVGRGKGRRHAFQAPHKKRGKGKRAGERGKEERDSCTCTSRICGVNLLGDEISHHFKDPP